MHLHIRYMSHKAAKGDPMAMPCKFTSEMLPAKRSGAVATEWVVGMFGAIRRRYRDDKASHNAFPGRSNTLRQRAIRRIFTLGFAGLLVGSSPGCTILSNLGSVFSASDACDEFMIGHRNSVMAAKAWYRVKPNYRNHPHRNSFRDGFIAGYIDVAEGGQDAPLLSPRRNIGVGSTSPPKANGRPTPGSQAFPMEPKLRSKTGLGIGGISRWSGCTNRMRVNRQG